MPLPVTLHLPIENLRDPDQQMILERAVAILNRVVNAPDFLDRVRDASYVRTGWKSTSGRRRNFTPPEIAQRIADGRERATPIDQEIDIRLALRVADPPTLGSTTLGKLPIRPAYWFVDRCVRRNVAGPLASHLMHEWLHASGFFHKKKGIQSDVPYVVGRIVGKMIRTQFVEEHDEELSLLAEEGDCGCWDADDDTDDIEGGPPEDE